MKPTYRIEIYWEKPFDKWQVLFPFDSMQKSYAMGAWHMLKAHYNQTNK
jgi:hypothetical protein